VLVHGKAKQHSYRFDCESVSVPLARHSPAAARLRPPAARAGPP